MMAIACCENCRRFGGRTADGTPVCHAETLTWTDRAMVTTALKGTNALNRCTLFRLDPNASDDEPPESDK